MRCQLGIVITVALDTDAQTKAQAELWRDGIIEQLAESLPDIDGVYYRNMNIIHPQNVADIEGVIADL